VEQFSRKIAARIHHQAALSQKTTQSKKGIVEKKKANASDEHHYFLSSGIACMAVGAISGGLAFYFNAKAKKNYDAYSALIYDPDIQNKWESVALAQERRDVCKWVGIGVGSLGVLLTLGDVVFTGKKGLKMSVLQQNEVNVVVSDSILLTYRMAW
jgi:hypothetical protein